MMRVFSSYAVIFLVGFILIFSPLGFGGKFAFSQMITEWVGWLILLFVFWFGTAKGKIFPPVIWFIVVCFLIVGIYLLPLPDSVWLSLPGRELYVQSASLLEITGGVSWYKTLSVIPLNGFGFLLACVPALAIFLVACSASLRHLSWLVYAAIACASFQSLLAMIQFFSQDAYWYFGIQSAAPMGTYLNQNHLTALLEMVEPLTIALMIHALMQQGQVHSVVWIGKALLFAVFSLILLFVPLIASSRMGVALLFLSLVLSFWTMTTPELRRRVAAPIIGLRLIVLGMAVLLQFGVVRSVSKVISEDMAPAQAFGDLRWELWRSGMEGIQAMFPFGSGPSTFAKVYKAYQPENFGALVSHMHNDYLELLFEFGLFGVLMVMGLLVLYIYQWRYVLRMPMGLSRLLQSGAGVGVLLFALYSLTDFSLHVPTNVLFFVFLLAIFFRRLPDGEAVVAGSVSRDKSVASMA